MCLGNKNPKDICHVIRWVAGGLTVLNLKLYNLVNTLTQLIPSKIETPLTNNFQCTFWYFFYSSVIAKILELIKLGAETEFHTKTVKNPIIKFIYDPHKGIHKSKAIFRIW